jgi:PilZ domain
VDVPIRVIAGDLSSADVILGRGTKLSAGGICFFALANLAIGSRIDVELIESLCDKPMRVSGVIRNRVVYLYGVEFLINQPADRLRVTRLSQSFSGTTHLQSP